MLTRKPIRLLLVVPSLRRAGAETQAIELANGIDSKDFETNLFTFEAGLDQLDRLDQSCVSFFNYPRRFKLDFSIVRKMAQVIDKNEIDVIHCTMQFSLLMAWLALRLTRRRPKLVTAIHTTINRDRKGDLQDWLVYRYLMRACDSIVYVCQNQAAYWAGKFPDLNDRAVVIHNGVDGDYFHPESFVNAGHILRTELNIPASAPVLASVAGFRPEKGHRYLVKAFAAVEDNSYLLLAGDGMLRSQIQAQVHDAGIADRVRFLGNIADIRPVLAASDATILASTSVETFSMAMLESMSMGRPVIGSDIGGMAEAITHGTTGFLFPPGDVTILRRCIERVIRDVQLRHKMGAFSRERVTCDFTLSKMLAETQDLFRKLAGSRRYQISET